MTRTIESITEELKKFENEDITKVMNKYICKNCGNLSENLEIKKADSLEQLERFQNILNENVGSSYALYLDKKYRIDSFKSRMAYVTCPICRVKNYFEILKNIKG